MSHPQEVEAEWQAPAAATHTEEPVSDTMRAAMIALEDAGFRVSTHGQLVFADDADGPDQDGQYSHNGTLQIVQVG